MNSPVSTRKRCRDRIGSANESPLSRLLDQLKSLQRVAFISAGEANLLLSHLVVECLKDCVKIKNAEHLTAILSSYGWSCSEAAFTTPVNLAGLATAISKYRWVRVQELGSGSYAVVYKAKNRETGEIIALKKLRFGFDDQGVPSSTLREISLLKQLRHDNIVELKDVIFGYSSSSMYVVLEYLDCDLRHLLDYTTTPLTIGNIKSFMYQILTAVHFAHMRCVMHRDLKPQNILVDLAAGRVKVADFGLARSFLPATKAYTQKVVTLWYRAPELLLGAQAYTPAIDVWSIGCIFAELVNGTPLFAADSEIALLHQIFEALGTPCEASWRGVDYLANFRSNFPQWQHKGWGTLVPALAGDRQGLDLLASLLAYDPSRRITAGRALEHPWFRDVHLPAPLGPPAAAAAVAFPAAAAATAAAATAAPAVATQSVRNAHPSQAAGQRAGGEQQQALSAADVVVVVERRQADTAQVQDLAALWLPSQHQHTIVGQGAAHHIEDPSLAAAAAAPLLPHIGWMPQPTVTHACPERLQCLAAASSSSSAAGTLPISATAAALPSAAAGKTAATTAMATPQAPWPVQEPGLAEAAGIVDDAQPSSLPDQQQQQQGSNTGFARYGLWPVAGGKPPLPPGAPRWLMRR